MEEVCPAAWLLNITNPMTTLCRAVTRETEIATVGLCHEVTMARFTLSQLLDADFRAFDLTVTGVNHLPVVTAMKVGGDDGFELLRALMADADRRGDEPVHLPEGLGHEQHSFGGQFKKATCCAEPGEVFAVRALRRAARRGDRHLVEFFPGFLTEESGWGRRWGVGLYVDRGP
jgi:alpha-galactosidase